MKEKDEKNEKNRKTWVDGEILYLIMRRNGAWIYQKCEETRWIPIYLKP